jgi:prophage regulatory protein
MDEINLRLERIERLLQERRPARLIKLPEVLDRLGISRTTFWEGVQAGFFPAGLKHGNNRLWLESDIDTVIERMVGDASV